VPAVYRPVIKLKANLIPLFSIREEGDFCWGASHG
jgi:hypothetical protein